MSKMSEIDSDRQQIERLTDVATPPSFAQSGFAGAVQQAGPIMLEPGLSYAPQPVFDSEAQIIAHCIEQLKRLPDDVARNRVLAYLSSRVVGG